MAKNKEYILFRLELDRQDVFSVNHQFSEIFIRALKQVAELKENTKGRGGSVWHIRDIDFFPRK